MDLSFESQQLEALCGSKRDLTKKFGPDGAKKVITRLAALRVVPTLEAMRAAAGSCHELTGDRAGQLAVKLHGGFRLILVPADDPPPQKEDGGLDWAAVDSVRILEIADYH